MMSSYITFLFIWNFPDDNNDNNMTNYVCINYLGIYDVIKMYLDIQIEEEMLNNHKVAFQDGVHIALTLYLFESLPF